MKIKVRNFSNLAIFILISSYMMSASILSLFVPVPALALQVSMYGGMLLILVLLQKGVNIELRMLLFISVAVLSLMSNEVSAKYNAPVRLLLWVLLISSVGPLLYNASLIRLREKLFEIFLFIFMIIGVLSFFYWLLGFPSLGRGHFSGLMVHSMLLAPIVSLGGLYAFYRFMNESIGKKKNLFLFFFIISIPTVILAASRVSLIAFLSAFLFYIFLNKFRYRKWITLGTVFLGIWFGMHMGEKNYNHDNGGIQEELFARGIDNTREALWNDRIREFSANPIFGVGFASQDDSLVEEIKDTSGGQIEPGSTYLMVLSMTGLMGAATMIWFFLKAILSKDFWRRIARIESYKLASYIFFIIHFVAEGYLYAAGAFMACIFWLLVGATYPYSGISYGRKKIL